MLGDRAPGRLVQLPVIAPASDPDVPAPSARLLDRDGPILFALLALAFAVYANSLTGGWVYDDAWTITANTFIRRPENLLRLFRGGYPDEARQLQVVTTFIDYQLFGLRPFGWHLENVLWHAGCVVLLFRLARRFLPTRASGLAAALFAVAPIHTEVVACVSFREDLLVTFFFLAALLAWLRFVGGDRPAWLIAAALLAVLGTNAKESFVVFPVVALVAAVVVRGRGSTVRRPAAPLVLLIIATLAMEKWILALTGQGAFGYSYLAPGPGLGVRVITFLALLPRYLFQLVIPGGLNADYTGGYVTTLARADVPAGLALVGAGLFAFVRLRRTWPGAALGIAWFFLTLLPVSNVIPLPNVRCDRYLYLPSAGFFLAAAVLVHDAAARLMRPAARRALGPLLSTIIAVHGVCTIARNRVWHDGIALWSRTFADSPDSARAAAALLDAYSSAGRTAEADALARRLADRWPDVPDFRIAVGVFHAHEGRYRDAVREFELAERLGAKDRIIVRKNLARAWADAGVPERGRDVLLRTIEAWPAEGSLHAALARLDVEMGRAGEAEAEATRALELAPEGIEARLVLGELRLGRGDVAGARAMFEEVLRRSPREARAALQLARLRQGAPASP